MSEENKENLQDLYNILRSKKGAYLDEIGKMAELGPETLEHIRNKDDFQLYTQKLIVDSAMTQAEAAKMQTEIFVQQTEMVEKQLEIAKRQEKASKEFSDANIRIAKTVRGATIIIAIATVLNVIIFGISEYRQWKTSSLNKQKPAISQTVNPTSNKQNTNTGIRGTQRAIHASDSQPTTDY